MLAVDHRAPRTQTTAAEPLPSISGSRILDLFVKKVRDTAQHQKLPPPR